MLDTSDDFNLLVQRYVEGTLDENAAARLLSRLETETGAGTELLHQLAMDAMLRSTKPQGGMSRAPMLIVPRRKFTFAALSTASALAACLTLAGTLVVRSVTDSRRATDEATTASIAVLTRGASLEWERGSLSPAPGSPLSPGLLQLKSGLAQIEFYSGARLILEGPASLRLVSSGEASCSSGKLSVHVPPQARGFRIDTPKGVIVDLGTEFGLDLAEPNAEVHVFKGEVELHRPSAPMQSLKEGQAAALSDPAHLLAANATAFATLRELDQRAADSQRSQYERWQAAGTAWNNDAGLRLRLDFQDSESSRSLQNLARHGSGAPDGSIVGCEWSEGRWPGKHALDFRNVSDRVRLSIAGDTPALTLSCWVRINGLDRAFNSLFMCEGWGDRKIHWQITRDGRVRLGIAGKDSKPHVDYDAPAFFTPERFGRWTHLAVVVDPDGKEVRHYINGTLQASLPLRESFPIQLGVAELGNWNDRPGKERVAIRHLSGAMDEFALYARALNSREIAEQQRIGSPEQK